MTQKTIQDLVLPFVHGIEPYEPGKPIEEVERELKMHAIKLASNENPLGPSPRAVEAAREFLASVNRYPDGGGYYLRKKLSERLGVEMEKIILGNGSCELLDLSARTLLDQGDEALTSEGSFPLYYTAVRATGARLVCVPLREYTFDLDGFARAITPQTKLIFLANPNNPTGTMFTADDFEAFLGRVPQSVVVVLDEAYFDYAERPGYSRSLELVRAGKNILVLRTFSKVYGLAGLRIGYGIGPEELVGEINRVRAPFNTSSLSQAAALAALDDAEHVTKSVAMNRQGLAQLAEGLHSMGVRFVPSVANFLLVEVGPEARALADQLLKLGVIVRPMGWMGFAGAIRVTVGTREENARFLAGLAQLRGARISGSAGPAAGERAQR